MVGDHLAPAAKGQPDKAAQQTDREPAEQGDLQQQAALSSPQHEEAAAPARQPGSRRTGPQSPPPASFRERLVAEIPNLRGFAASLSGSMQTADDLVQDTLLKAWSHADSFQEGTNLRAWLFTILRNTYYSLYRKRGREVQDTDGLYSSKVAVPGEQDGVIDLADFRVALAKLPEEQREVLIMVGATGMSYEETAAICGIAIGTVKSRVNRARVKLAELLGMSAAGDSAANRPAGPPSRTPGTPPSTST